MTRVFITSESLMTCAGLGIEETFQALFQGASRFQEYGRTPVGLLPETVLQELSKIENRHQLRNHDRTTLMAVCLGEKVFDSSSMNGNDIACIIGSSRGPTERLESVMKPFFATGKVSPKASPTTTANVIPSTVARVFNLRGLHFYVSAACSTSLHAIGAAFAMIKGGVCQRAIAGGVEAATTPFTLKILQSAKIYSQFPYNQWPHRPLHPQRSGMVLADGAALVFLENQNKSSQVEILAYGAASESSGLTGVSESGEALQMAIESVLKQANLKAKDIDLIIGHGASTVKGDSAEIKAYHRIFGDSKMPPIVFHKWLTGHTLGAAGGTSIALAIKHLKSNLISPHPYFQEIDDDNRKRHRPVIERVLVVSLGFGGNAAAIILSLS